MSQLLAQTRPTDMSALTTAFGCKSGPDMLTSSSSVCDRQRRDPNPAVQAVSCRTEACYPFGLPEDNMPFMGKSLAIAMLSLAFTVTAGAQAPQVEKNVSMKMALMIIEGTLEQCTKDGYKVSVVVVDKAAMSLRPSAATGPIRTPWNLAGSRLIRLALAARPR